MKKEPNKTDDKWTCSKCGSVIVYEVKKDNAKFKSINKQDTKVRFVSFEATCRNCGNFQEIRSELVSKIYNDGFKHGFDYAINLVKKLDTDHFSLDSLYPIDWSNVKEYEHLTNYFDDELDEKINK